MAIKTFSHILPHLGVKFNPLAFFAQKRDFGMRVTASLGGPIPFSYFLALNGLITYFWLSQHTTKKKIVWGILAGFSIAILFTGSRGGLFAMLAGISMIFFYKVIARQWFFMVSSLLGVISYFIAFGLDQLRVIFGKIDEEGTFTYRIDLIKNSLKVVEKYFFFGNPKFIDDPALEPSRQGQGIIDIVNTFLQVVLEFGVVGLVCFVAMFYFASKGVLMRAVREGGLKTDTGRIGIMFFAMFVCTLVLIATCSAVGFIPLYYLVLIALASAYIRKNDELPFKGAEDTDESTAPESRAL